MFDRSRVTSHHRHRQSLPRCYTATLAVMTNISAAAQGRRVIKYASKNDPRPRRSAAKSKNFAKEGDSLDHDPTPYLFIQAINKYNPLSSSRSHCKKRAYTSINNENKSHHGQGATQKMPPPPKLGDRVKKARRRPGPTKEINKQNSVHTTTTHYLPPHPQNINQHKAPKTYSWFKGTTCKMSPPQKLGDRIKKMRRL